MKKLFFLLLIAPCLLWGQLPTRKEIRDVKQINRELQREYDVVLDPIEQIGISPRSVEDYDAGNWGNVALEVDRYFDQIIARSKRRVHVYIFDTAGKWGHDALKFVEKPGQTFTGEATPEDGNGHSTHCAGIIGGVTDFPLGVSRALIEKENLCLYPVKVLSNNGSGLYSWISTAIKWANERSKTHLAAGDFVIYSFSLGGSSGNDAVTQALAEAAQIGVLTVAASGNTGGKGVNFPGNAPAAKAIAALQNTAPLTRAAFSTFGPEVWLSMPGQGILSSYKGNTYATLSGTSMATPHAAGIAAIAASVHPTFNALQIVTLLEKVATDIAPTGRDEHTGFGVDLINGILNYSGGTPTPDPKPEPPKPVEPVKPERNMVFDFAQPFQVVWSGPGLEWKPLQFRAKVAFRHKKMSNAAAVQLESLTSEHWTNRGYYLFSDSDEADALYWVAYFYEMILGKAGHQVDVLEIRSTLNPAVVVYDPITTRATQAKANRAKAVTFERVE